MLKKYSMHMVIGKDSVAERDIFLIGRVQLAGKGAFPLALKSL